MRSPSSSIASTVRNIGAVKLMAVKSASGIIVSAVNQQNMLAVPANERTACDFSLSVRKTCRPSTRQAMNAEHGHGDHAAHEDDLPRRHAVAQVLHARGEAREQHDRRELQRIRRGPAGDGERSRTTRGRGGDRGGAHHSRAGAQFALFLRPRGGLHAHQDRYVVAGSVRLECHCRGASAERRSAVRAALRRVPRESRRGRHPESRADGRVRAERDRRVADRRHDAAPRPSAVARRAHRDRRAPHGPPRARRIPARAARSSAPRARRSRRASGRYGTAGAPTRATRAISPMPAASRPRTSAT